MSRFALMGTPEFGDAVGLDVWAQAHADEHTQFTTMVLASSHVPLYAPLDNGPGTPQWLAAHQAMHMGELQSLGVGQVPDLEDAIWNVAEWFYIWMDAHSQIHQAERTAWGL